MMKSNKSLQKKGGGTSRLGWCVHTHGRTYVRFLNIESVLLFNFLMKEIDSLAPSVGMLLCCVSCRTQGGLCSALLPTDDTEGLPADGRLGTQK